jgi:hypothetical protein
MKTCHYATVGKTTVEPLLAVRDLKVGTRANRKSRKYTATLKPDDIPTGQKFGLTLVSIRLVPQVGQVGNPRPIVNRPSRVSEPGPLQ